MSRSFQSFASYDGSPSRSTVHNPQSDAFALPFSTQSVPTSCISRSSSLASWNELPSNFNQVEYYHAPQPAMPYDQPLWDSSNNGNGYLPPPHHPGMELLNQAPRSEAFQVTTEEESLPHSNDAVPVASSSTVIPRRSPLEAVRSSPTVRQAAKLRVDVGLADISSPQSHEARLQQRRKRSGAASFSPYDRGPPVVPSSALSSAGDPQPGKKVTKKRKAPQEKTTEQYGAQRTFIFNPYNNPPVVAIGDDTFTREDLPPPLPEPCDLTESPGPMFPESEPPLQQTIRLSDPPSPDSASGKKNKYDDRHTGIDPATGEKKPFLACGFCRQRKVCYHARI